MAIAIIGCSDDGKLPEPSTMPGGGGPAAPSTQSTGAPAGAPAAAPGDGAGAVTARKCADCHGGNLAGSSTALPGYDATIQLFAPNLTSDADTGVGGWTDGQLRLAIREGVDRDGMVLCPQMQHYRSMPDAEVDSIIKYLRTLPPVKNAVRGSVCPPLKR
jgi:hypothetical protein